MTSELGYPALVSRQILRRLPKWLFYIGVAFASLPSFAQVDVCGELYTDHFGPFDYRTINRFDLRKVEKAHFSSQVENLVRGDSSTIGADIAYTLKAIPNHPRALAAMAALARKERRPTPRGSDYSIECWFERATRFAPNDPAVPLIMAIDLMKDGKTKAALIQLKTAEGLAPDNPNVHYNLGLAYFDLKDYENSLASAKRAYELGFPLPGLREKLARAGKWKD